MTKCDDTQVILLDLNYQLIKSLYVGKQGCRHVYRNLNNRYAYSDTTGAYFIDLDKSDADKHFNAAVIKPKTELEDIDATLKELEDNLKVIAVRALSYISDFVDKLIGKLS